MFKVLCIAAVLTLGQASQSAADRKPHPFAPSLPLLSKEEYEKIDATIDRFIDYDTGKLKGDAGKKALDDFNKLGPEAIFNLIDGLNRAANLESSCPAVIIGRKVGKILGATDDMQLLIFAKDNIGAGVTAKRHTNTLQDLQFAVLLRKSELQKRAAAAKGKSLGNMSLAELEKMASSEKGGKLKSVFEEVEKRQGSKAADILITGIANSDADIAKLSQSLLTKNIMRQGPDTLKKLMQHDRMDVRIAAAQAVGSKKLRLAPELIALLQDSGEDVRQAARRALVQIANGTDYGPAADASSSERQDAYAAWRDWWSRQKK